MMYKISDTGALDLGDSVEHHRKEGRVEAYGRILETLKAMQECNHDMTMSEVIDAVDMLKEREMEE